MHHVRFSFYSKSVKIPTLKEVGIAKLKFLQTSKLFQFIDNFFIKRGITANQITIVSQTFHILSAYFLFNDQILFSTFFVISRILDAYDGYYAKITRSESKLGDFLDHGGDFLGSFLMLIKSMIFLHSPLSFIAFGFYILNTIVIFVKKYYGDTFAAANFPYFYMFGLYNSGLVFNIISNLSVIGFVFVKTAKKKNNIN